MSRSVAFRGADSVYFLALRVSGVLRWLAAAVSRNLLHPQHSHEKNVVRYLRSDSSHCVFGKFVRVVYDDSPELVDGNRNLHAYFYSFPGMVHPGREEAGEPGRRPESTARGSAVADANAGHANVCAFWRTAACPVVL